jgi:outer membrane protease
MIYIKINENLYPATIYGKLSDADWDGRETKSITLTMDYASASQLFVNGLAWRIVEQNSNDVKEYDNSAFNLAGDLTDHRDGTITIKMGKLTPLEEAYEILFGGLEYDE